MTDSNRANDLDHTDAWALCAFAELLVLAPNNTTEVAGDRAKIQDGHAAVCEALEHDPSSFEALFIDTAFCMHLLDYETALDRAKRGLAIQPASVTLLANMALSLQQLGRRDEALAVIDKAVAAMPEAEGMHYLRGKMRMELPQPDCKGALEDLNLVLKGTRVQVDAVFYRGMAHHGLGELREAIADYDLAERAMPTGWFVPKLRALREDARTRLGR
jgi:tetratricopeptide (TPR) repeat protein